MDTTKLTYDVSRRYLQDRKTTLPIELWHRLHGLVRARDHRSLATCFTDSIHDVTSVEGVRTLAQVEAFFKKNASFTDRVCARLEALISFEKGEELCRETNARLDNFYAEPDLFDPDLREKVRRCQRYISTLLGNHSDFLKKLPENIKVTAGATVTKPRRRAFPFMKVNKRVICTPGAYPYLESLADCFGYGPISGRLVTRNRIEFVPKSWKTERTIACEAEGNMILQLAFDSYAKSRLRRKGINLSDQTRNQLLAKEGSICDNLATIDLSMASDTLAYNTVALLFPDEWFRYLRAIRSQYYAMYKDSREAYHKFSSMGNGATFSVETMVFAAACYAVGSKTYSVYGDDIIIESELAEPLTELLAFFGFVPNHDKTYISGPFRESCGRSWYRGFNVTPKYLRGVDSRKATICHLVNILVTIADPYGSLMELAVKLTRDCKLPILPYNEDSMSGVWVDTHTAYEKKTIRTRNWIPYVKAYQAKTKGLHVSDSRALFLWYSRTIGRDVPDLPYESSRYSISSHKYVRKWIHWNPPVAGAPENIYYFSDELFRQNNG